MAIDAETRVRVNQKGQIVIPAAYRKTLGINAGEPVFLRVEDGELRIMTMRRRIERAQEHVRRYVKAGTSLVDEFLAERRGL